MGNEKLEILNMIRDKAITPEEGLKLLEAIQKKMLNLFLKSLNKKKR